MLECIAMTEQMNNLFTQLLLLGNRTEEGECVELLLQDHCIFMINMLSPTLTFNLYPI